MRKSPWISDSHRKMTSRRWSYEYLLCGNFVKKQFFFKWFDLSFHGASTEYFPHVISSQTHPLERFWNSDFIPYMWKFINLLLPHCRYFIRPLTKWWIHTNHSFHTMHEPLRNTMNCRLNHNIISGLPCHFAENIAKEGKKCPNE